MALCTKAKDLIKELGRSEWLPPYNEELMRQIMEETSDVSDQVREVADKMDHSVTIEDPEYPLLLLNVACINRNKRAALTYVNYRVEKIKQLRWQTGSVVPENVAPVLCARETQFFHDYDQVLNSYMSAFNIDLSADIQPPKELYIEVRVIKDCGEIYTENGPVQLHANTTHFLRRTDVEGLIRQGLLIQVKH